MTTLKQILSKKTDAELLFYIENVDKHTDEAVRLALSELQSRNFALPSDTDDRIEEQLKEKAVRIEEAKKTASNRNVVEDPDAPLYYSESAINVFSLLFSVFFGSFLLASNCKDAGRKQWFIIPFGLIYTLSATVILSQFQMNMTYTFIANASGVYIMHKLFWEEYIGNDTKYRAKPIWKPLIIGLAIFIPLTIFIIKHKPRQFKSRHFESSFVQRLKYEA